jgi:hypothetical protein
MACGRCVTTSCARADHKATTCKGTNLSSASSSAATIYSRLTVGILPRPVRDVPLVKHPDPTSSPAKSRCTTRLGPRSNTTSLSKSSLIYVLRIYSHFSRYLFGKPVQYWPSYVSTLSAGWGTAFSSLSQERSERFTIHWIRDPFG